MFTSTVIQAGHTVTFTITRRELGWEARELHDREVVRTTHYTDWHRVERAIEGFRQRKGTGLASES
jgi:hypothetical protein